MANQQSETHRFFPSGDWEGFYMYKNNGEKHQMNFSLNFKNGIITGSGSDDVGDFSWKGTYSTETFNCKITKNYGTHTIEYPGHADENGIWGNWVYGTDDSLKQYDPELVASILKAFEDEMTGGFHFWPRKNEKNEQEEAIEEMVIKKEKQLVKPLA